MKILIINSKPPNSGIGRYSFNLALSLRKIIDDKVNLLTWWPKPLDLVYAKAKNSKALIQLEETLRVIAHFQFMINVLRSSKHYDLVHITNASIAFLGVATGTYCVTVHDLISFATPRSISDFFIQMSMQRIVSANRVICVSGSTKGDLLRFMDIDLKKVRVIYYGVDHELFRFRDKLEARRKLGLPLDKPIVLNVGSEEPRKNIPTLLRSFKKLLNDVPNALLVRVGERAAQTEKLIRMFGLDGKIMYRRASPREISLYYNAADLLVHPAYYEGFGNPPLEAMASALPVIAGNRTSIPEVVGDAGILLDPFDVDGFAYWMQEVLTNEDLRARLSEVGYKRSLSFSWEKCAKETMEVYREVLDEA